MSKFQPRSIAIPGMFELRPTDAKGNGLSMRLAVRCTSVYTKFFYCFFGKGFACF